MEAATVHQQGLLRCLKNHERAKQQIVLLDRLIQRHHRQIERSLQLGRRGQALHYMGCKTVVQTVKYLYKQYFFRSWLQVQVEIWKVLQAQNPNCVPPSTVTTAVNFHDEREQVDKYHQDQALAQCSFSRAS